MAALWIALGALAPQTASASPGFAIAEGSRARPDHALGFGYASPAWATLALRHRSTIPSRPFPGRFSAGAGVDLPVLAWAATRSVDSARLAARSSWVAVERGLGRVVADAELGWATQRSVMGRWDSFDLRLSVLGGLGFRRGALLGLVSVQQGLGGHLRHSSYVRETFAELAEPGEPAAGPKRGWYRIPQRRWLLGLGGAVALGWRWRLYGSAALRVTERDVATPLASTIALGNWPFFFELGASVGFR